MGGGEVDVESSQPVFYSKASNLSSASHGDSMVINSVTYKIINKSYPQQKEAEEDPATLF